MSALKERLGKNLILFGRTISPATCSSKSPPFHYEIAANILDDSVERLNIIAPRGHAKSSLVGLFAVLHHLFHYKKTRHKVVVLCSLSEGHSVRLLQTIKDTLDYSQPLREIYGYHGRYNARRWQEKFIELDTGDFLIARGMGQMVIGMKHLNQRPTMIVLDDPEDMTNTKTEASLDYNSTWVLQSLMPAGDLKYCKRIVIGTPQHQLCVVEKLKENPEWKTLAYSAELPDGGVLWPEQCPREKLDSLRREAEGAGKLSMYYREYLCQIVGADEQLFRPSDIHYYRGTISWNKHRDAFLHMSALDDHLFEEEHILPVAITMGVDPASSLKQGACYSTIVPVATDRSDNRYILPYFRKRVQPMDLAEEIVKMYEFWHPRKTTIETTGYQEMLRDYLRRRISIPGLEVPEKPTTEKNLRLESMQPFFRAGKVFLQDSMREMTDELFMFPRGRSRDLMDGLYYAFRGVYPAVHELTKPLIVEPSSQLKHYAGLWDLDPALVLEVANERLQEQMELVGRTGRRDLEHRYVGEA